MPDRFVRYDVRGFYCDQLVVNTYWYRIARFGLWDNDPFEGIYGLLLTDMGSIYNHISVSSCTYTQVVMHLFDSDRENDQTQTRNVTWASTDDDPGLPPQVSAVVQRAGLNPGTRRHRGKVCYAGVGRASVSNGLMVTGNRMWTYMTAAAAMIVRVQDEGHVDLPNMILEPVIGNFRQRIPLGGQWNFRRIATSTPRRATGTQRHRALGHGRV